jgi:hypothetical protein
VIGFPGIVSQPLTPALSPPAGRGGAETALWRSLGSNGRSSMTFPHAIAAPSPRLRGEGWGEGRVGPPTHAPNTFSRVVAD